MAVSGATITAPVNGGNLPATIVRPRINCVWTAGVGPYDIEYTWDDDATFANGNGNRQQVTNLGVSGTTDSAVPTADLGDLTVTWYLRVVVTDTDDSSTSTDNDNTFVYIDPDAQNRYLYLLANVGVGFDDTDDNSGSTGYVSQSYPDGTVLEQNRYLYLLANLGVGFDDTDDNSGSTGFVSQSYPDGTVIGQNRYLYLLANVIAALRRQAQTFSSMTMTSKPRGRPKRGSPRSWT